MCCIQEGRKKKKKTPVPTEKKESIEHIFANREVPNPLLVQGHVATAAVPPKVREFYVKWFGRSYMHAEWLTEARLVEMGFKKKMRNYLEKRQNDISGIEESELGVFFPQEYLEVDRVIASQPPRPAEPDGSGAAPQTYLVKWRQLAYTEATWETAEDIGNDEKIREFERVNVPPAPERIDQTGRQYKWEQLDDSVAFRNENKLRAYQLEGLNWLLYCWHERRGCVLADEMGLGKTIQAVTFCNQVRAVRFVSCACARVRLHANKQRVARTHSCGRGMAWARSW